MRAARALLACAFACATAFAAGANGASSGTVITADIPSASTIVNGCTAALATQFGSVLPDSGARTATGPGVCRITFGASNATSQLRISQKDGTGTALALGMQAPTELANVGAPGRTTGVFGASDELYAWVVGRQATAYRTSNGGASWNVGTTINGLTSNHTDVEFVPGSPATVYVTGESRYLRRATDGTSATVNFANVSAPLATAGWPAAVDINELSIPDNDTIVIVGESRWFGLYDISSTTWTTVQHTNNSIGNVRAVDALDRDTFLAIGDNDKAMLNTNRGTTSADWVVSTVVPGSDLTDVAWGGTNRAYAVGERGVVATWDGATWTDRSSNLGIAADIRGVDAVPGSPNSVLVADERGAVYRSDDAGVTWTITATGSDSRVEDIHAATAQKIYVPAAERTFTSSSNGGASWTIVGPNSSEILSSISASPTNGQRLLAVGTQAYRSTNGGTGWSAAAIPGGSMLDVSLVDDSTGWAVGYAGRIRFTTDLGATWSTQAAPAGVTQRLLGVRGLDRFHAVAVGDEGRIIATTNGGTTWTTRTSGTTRQLTSVDADGSTVLAVGGRGTIVRSTDAGATWSVVPGGSVPDSTSGLVAVTMASATVAYAATSTDVVWKSTDGGLTWGVTPSTTGTYARDIDASGSSVIVVGLDYSTSRSFDGGSTWSQATGPTTLHLNGVVAIDPHVAAMVGGDATRALSVAQAGADAQVADWSAPANDWDSGGFFGVCLQDVAGGALADWTEDATGMIGECEANGVDPWRALPATGSLAAHTNAAGLGTVDLVWGFRPKTSQTPGVYEAGVAFEAISP